MGDSPTRRELLQEIRALRALVTRLQQQMELEGRTRSAATAADRSPGPAGEYLRSLGHYAGSIAHDLNNLLVGILGNAGLALMDLSTFSSCRPLIQEVEEAAQRAAALANQMLSFAPREDSGQIPAPSAGTESFPAVSTARPATTWRGEGLVLVVDDEVMVRNLAKKILEKFGFKVMTAEDGRQAIEIFEPHAAEFIAVLLDVTMPHLDGAQTFQELRRLRPEIKVIFSSGYDERGATRRIVRQGLAEFLHKPYLPMQLVDKLRKVLER